MGVAVELRGRDNNWYLLGYSSDLSAVAVYRVVGNEAVPLGYVEVSVSNPGYIREYLARSWSRFESREYVAYFVAGSGSNYVDVASIHVDSNGNVNTRCIRIRTGFERIDSIVFAEVETINGTSYVLRVAGPSDGLPMILDVPLNNQDLVEPRSTRFVKYSSPSIVDTHIVSVDEYDYAVFWGRLRYSVADAPSEANSAALIQSRAGLDMYDRPYGSYVESYFVFEQEPFGDSLKRVYGYSRPTCSGFGSRWASKATGTIHAMLLPFLGTANVVVQVPFVREFVIPYDLRSGRNLLPVTAHERAGLGALLGYVGDIGGFGLVIYNTSNVEFVSELDPGTGSSISEFVIRNGELYRAPSCEDYVIPMSSDAVFAFTAGEYGPVDTGNFKMGYTGYITADIKNVSVVNGDVQVDTCNAPFIRGTPPINETFINVKKAQNVQFSVKIEGISVE